MNRIILMSMFILVAFISGYSFNNIAVSSPDYKIAVVDIQRIVANSSQVRNLKREQDLKLKDMQKIINQAQEEISKESDKTKIAQLEDKYREKLNNQKLALDYEYNEKLTQIDKDIKSAVVDKAKFMNYQIVLPKSFILYGGDDITEEIAKAVK